MVKPLLVVLIILGPFLAGVPIALVAITGAAHTLPHAPREAGEGLTLLLGRLILVFMPV
jgi:methyl coenzyme M reductase subunit C-like uncharacterized protein (methanogenesis marker protein 7)